MRTFREHRRTAPTHSTLRCFRTTWLLTVVAVACAANTNTSDAQGLLVLHGDNATTSFVRGSDVPDLLGPRSPIPLTQDSLVFRTELQSVDIRGTHYFGVAPANLAVNLTSGSITAAPNFDTFYDVYVLVRMKHEWETYVSLTLQRDMERTAQDMQGWERRVRPTLRLVTPPRQSSATTSSEHRISVHRLCTSFSDECQQESLFTYTRSYVLLIPGSGQTGRVATVLYHVRGMYTIGIHSRLPIDAFTTVEAIVVMTPSTRTWYHRLGVALLISVATLIAVVAALAAVKQWGLRSARAQQPLASSWREEVSQLWQRSMGWVAEQLQYRVRYSRLRLFSLLHLRRGDAPRGDEQRAPTEAPAAASTTSDDEDGDVCRICHSEAPSEDLFAPCRCNGSSRLVHRACLERWRASTTNPAHRLVCAECKTPFQLRLTRESTALTDTVLMTILRRLATVVGAVALCVLSGTIVKGLCFVVTLGDPNIRWDLYHLFHWVLGLAAVMSFFVTVAFLRYLVEDYPSHLTQRLPLLLGLSLVMPVSWGYAVSSVFDLFCYNISTGEVNFCLGVSAQFFFLVYMSPRLLNLLETTIVTRQEVLDRSEAGSGDGRGVDPASPDPEEAEV